MILGIHNGTYSLRYISSHSLWWTFVFMVGCGSMSPGGVCEVPDLWNKELAQIAQVCYNTRVKYKARDYIPKYVQSIESDAQALDRASAEMGVVSGLDQRGSDFV